MSLRHESAYHVDATSGLVHILVRTSARVADIAKTAELLHGKEEIVFADAGYTGIEKRAEIQELNQDIHWQVAKRRGIFKKMVEEPEKELLWAEEYAKASVRAIVEHPFQTIKNVFGYDKVRYRGLAKNESRLYTLFASANLLMLGRKLVPASI